MVNNDIRMARCLQPRKVITHWLREQNKQCDVCAWFGHCGGGCRALGILDAGEKTGRFDYSASDPLACLFFKGGWYDKVRDRLEQFAKD